MKSLIVILIMAVSTLGPAIVIAVVGYAAIFALGRNPSAASKILVPMIISIIFAEAIAIIALLVVFQIFTK